MPRLAVLWCPHWAVAAAGATAADPVAVLHANRVVAHSVAAAAEGIAVGQRRRDAQARCPHVRLVAHDPGRDRRAFEPVVQAVAQVVPRVEVGGAEGGSEAAGNAGRLAFMARGPSRYFGGDEAMAAHVLATAQAAATASGVSFAAAGGLGLGLADGRFTAGVAARDSVRAGAPVVVPPGAGTAAYLAERPVALLQLVAGVDPGFVHLLGRLGVRTLGDLAALPAADVLARFGHVGAVARAMAAGHDERPPDVHDPPPGLHVTRSFDEPVQQVDTLVFVARTLVDELVGMLAAEGRVCTALVVTAETEHGERCEREWHRSTGLGAAAMVERVRWQLDAWAQQESLTAGVILLRLEPVEVRGDDGVQLGLWGGRTEADEWAARAVARLVTLVGEQQVLVPAALGGRDPFDTYTWVPALTADLAEPGDRLAVGPGPWPGALPSPSPALVHRPPLPIDVLDADGAPVRVSGRGVLSAPPALVRLGAGEPLAVRAWAGPWPVEERWWDAVRARRVARFQLLVGGRSGDQLLLTAVERGHWIHLATYA